MATSTRRTANNIRDPPPSRGGEAVTRTSVEVARGTVLPRPTMQPLEVTADLERPPPARTKANLQPSPSRVEEVEDDEGAEARDLEALNQMHEELQEKRHRIKAHQSQAR
jgi:hypothetical protein